MSAGSASNSNFENAFADAAYADVKTKAPGLVTYMVGFQVLDVNDDETRAAAVFGFKVNNTWIFVPAFFINGRIRGMDMMYIRGNDMFVPLRDDWVSHLLSKSPDMLGETEDRERSELHLRSPDYAYSMRGEGLAKASSSEAPFFQAAREFWDMYSKEAAALDPEKVWPKLLAIPGRAMDLRGFVEKSAKIGSALYNELYRNPDLKTAAGWLYDPRSLPKEASAAYKPWGGFFRDRLGIPEYMTKMAAEKNRGSGVVRVTHRNATLFRPLMGEEKIAELYAKGSAILDFRKQSADLVVQIREGGELLTTPRDSGPYTLVASDGVEHDAYVFTRPRIPAYGDARGVSLVYFRDLDAGGLYATNSLTARRATKDGVKVDGKLVNVKEMKEWRAYALVFPDGTCSVPFQLRKRNITDYGETWTIGVDTLVRGESQDVCSVGPLPGRYSYVSGPPEVSVYSTNPNRSGDRGYVDSMNRASEKDKYTDSKEIGYEFTHLDKKMYVPNNEYGEPWLLIVRDDATPGVMSVTAAGVTVDGEARVLELGDAALLRDRACGLPKFNGDRMLDQVIDGGADGVEGATVHRDREMVVTVQGITGDLIYKGRKEAGVVPLMERFNVSEKSAREILDGDGRVYIKGGAKIDDNLSVPWPSDTRETGGHEFGWPSMVSSHEATQVVDSLLPTAGDVSSYNVLRDEEVTKMIAAAREGRKDVFDVSMVKGLVKSVDVSEQIDEFIPDLLRGLDRVGRIRFLFYWHLDDFEERYGRQDVAELDDSLKTVFNSMGDLILFLRSKSLEDQPELRSMDMSLADIS